MTDLQRAIIDAIIDGLMEDCHVCKGSGKYEESLRNDKQCYFCNGSGRAISEFGEEIVNFIRASRTYTTLSIRK